MPPDLPPRVPRTKVPLRDLGREETRWQGILSPVYKDSLVASFVHAEFLENAAQYAQKYQDTEHWKQLLKLSQRYYEVPGPHPLILDIGSGAGNSVFPLLELYPKATIVASDLSLPLLKVLKDYLDANYGDHSCVVMQLNAEELVFEDNQFDYIVGGSILHHLFAPDKTIQGCYNVLKPGGVAVFFEPFELGNQVLALGLRHLTRRSSDIQRRRWWRRGQRDEPIDSEILKFFESMYTDTEIRKGTDKSAAIFMRLEDKWLFTRSYFEQLAQRVGFATPKIYPHNPFEDNVTPFTTQVGTLLRLGMQRSFDALPVWAREYLTQLDLQFSREVCQELIIEGTIILRK